MQVKYGPPPIDIDPPQPMYGVYPNKTSLSFYRIITIITSPVLIIVSFIVGTILYLITHKKIFIIIPLILSFFYLLRRLIETYFGFSLY